jgi:hypothetical protein
LHKNASGTRSVDKWTHHFATTKNGLMKKSWMSREVLQLQAGAVASCTMRKQKALLRKLTQQLLYFLVAPRNNLAKQCY